MLSALRNKSLDIFESIVNTLEQYDDSTKSQQEKAEKGAPIRDQDAQSRMGPQRRQGAS